MFINFSNHASSTWSSEQNKAAEQYGEIIDVPFPSVSPNICSDEVHTIAKDYADRIFSMTPKTVLCQGEFTLCFAVVSILKSRGINVVAACSERVATEKIVNGTTEKIANFSFVQFREYI